MQTFSSALKPYPLVAVLGLLLLPMSVFAVERVLLINSYHPQYAWGDELTMGVVEGLGTRIKPDNLHIEYLDGRRFVQDARFERLATRLFKYKYKTFRPQVIISGDDYALELLLKNPKLFGEIPVIYGGINTHDFETHPVPLHFTGIREGSEIWGNLLLIKQLRPQTRKIYLLSDQTPTGISLTVEAQHFITEWNDPNTELVSVARLTRKGLFSLVDSANETDAFLILTLNRLEDGTYFSFSEDLKPLTLRSKAPFFGMWGAILLGSGVVGGWMNSPKEHGRRLAKMAIEILDGEHPDKIPPVAKDEYSPAFDYTQLQRFSIPFSALPENSKIINQPRTVYSEYQGFVLATVLILIWLLIVILILANNVRRRQRAEHALNEANQRLEQKVALRTRELSQANKQLSELNEESRRQARTDVLTQLPNRRAGNEYLQDLADGGRNPDHPLSIALLDIDHFKAINDEFGHNEGDLVLIKLAQRLQAHKRSQDFVCRWGGEEFLLILTETSKDEAIQLTERIRQDLESKALTEHSHPTASLGVSTGYRVDEWELLHQADSALYQAKSAGRNQIQYQEALVDDSASHKQRQATRD